MQGRSRLEKPKAPHRDFGKVPGEDIVTVHTRQACTRGYPDDRGRLEGGGRELCLSEHMKHYGQLRETLFFIGIFTSNYQVLITFL